MSQLAKKHFTRGTYLGTCPQCGDEVYWYKAKSSRGRYCRCVNPTCKFSGPLPKKGRLESTGMVCDTYPGVLVGVESNATDNPADARRYFWQAGPEARPCVTCRNHATCAAITDAAEGLGEEWAA
ncbi:MAG TPA: hypothetical protein VKK79_00620 [Candidatus Lokiarchaeia archaeon]|nr:hypothetical protein [Candidatus Lokiarchaeia archaeon]